MSRKINKRNAIGHAALAYFQSAYPGCEICKEDIFYYIYGIFHSPDYRAEYQNNLVRQLPRIPRVADYGDFVAFRDAGIHLAKVHLFYEQVPLYQGCELEARDILTIEKQEVVGGHDDWFYVEKMRVERKSGGSTIIYNDHIKIHGIPEMAWEYKLGGVSALNHIITRQSVTRDKRSGIVNNANDYAESIKNVRYPLELFLRIVTVSLFTLNMQKKMPTLNFNSMT